MRFQRLIVVCLLGLLILGYGCSKNSTSPTASPGSDTQQISELIANEDSSSFSAGDIGGSDGILSVGDDTSATGTDTTIVPVKWGRIHMRVVSKTISTTYNSTEDTASVEVNWTIAGVLRLVTATDTIDKPYRDAYLQKASYIRIGKTFHRAHNWKLVAVTTMTAITESVTSPYIASVTWFRKGNGTSDWTQTGSIVTDAVNFWQTSDNLPNFQRGDSLMLRVTTTSTDSYYGQIHYYPNGNHAYQRLPFHSPTTGTWEVVAYIPTMTELSKRLLYVDFLADNSVHRADDVYKANIWGLLYKVVS